MKTITYDETQWKLMPLKATSAMVDVLEFGRKQPTHNTYLNLLAAAPTPPAADQAQQDAEKAGMIERIASEWDGCIYDAGPSGDIDIGAAIRRAAALLEKS